MSSDAVGHREDALTVLRRFARMRTAAEQCEFCSKELGSEHQHLIEPATKRLICACDACAVLFPGSHATYKRIPRVIRALTDFRITDEHWDSLLIPIGMAFFYDSSPAGRVLAVYPSPAGATESLLPLDAWREITRVNPILAGMERDVEALLVKRLSADRVHGTIGSSRHEYFIVPIDECFRLVGLIRLHWKGLAGGSDVWRELSGFFDRVRSRAIPATEVARA
jgi:hypothetical protein